MAGLSGLSGNSGDSAVMGGTGGGNPLVPGFVSLFAFWMGGGNGA